jgi:rhodanese-related sulfurtransferase
MYSSSHAFGLDEFPRAPGYGKSTDKTEETVDLEQASVHESRYLRRANHGHCGLYALIAAAVAIERPIRIERLLRREYLESARGSTGPQLVRAARDNGLFAAEFQNFNADALTESRSPALLLMETSATNQGDYHWVAFLGIDLDRYLALDPPNEVEHYTYAELMLNWTGSGVFIDARPITTAPYISLPLRLLGLLVVVSAALFAMHFLLNSKYPLECAARLPAEAGALLIVCGTWIVAEHVSGLAPLAFNRDLVSVVTCASRQNGVVPDSLTTSWPDPECLESFVVIDCRTTDQFISRHVPGALHLPVDADARQVVRFIERHGSQLRDKKALYYCSSEKCMWADSVMQRMACLGFRNASVVRGGIRAWIANQANKTPSE